MSANNSDFISRIIRTIDYLVYHIVTPHSSDIHESQLQLQMDCDKIVSGIDDNQLLP